MANISIESCDETFRTLSKKFKSVLTSKQREQLSRILKTYNAKESNSDKDYYISSLVRDLDLPVLKAFLFTENITYLSLIQRKAFENLHGEELRSYFRKFFSDWEEGETATNWEGGWIDRIYHSVPIMVFVLIENRDFGLEYAKPWLVHNKVEVAEKNRIIHHWASSIQDYWNSFLTTGEVNFILNLEKELQVDISPIFPSIRNLFSLQGVPDDWIVEAYVTGDRMAYPGYDFSGWREE